MRKAKELLINFIHGFCMALADSVPGVSGGTVAFLLGFYDRFIGSLDDLFHGKGPAKVAALSFLVFVLLYMPCVAAFSAIRREMNSWKWAVGTVAFQTGVAWVVSFVVYQFTQLAVNLAGLF